MAIPALVWGQVPAHSPFDSRREAQGYWPGWKYRLDKLRDGTWWASFIDNSRLVANEPTWRVIGRGNFTQARAACIAHHNHPE